MASKQLEKLRQWAGEKISSTGKTSLPDDFKDLERDVELRRIGIERLHIASQAYHHGIVKKVEASVIGDTEESGKMLPIEGLGLVMISHGDEFGPDSAYGQSLVKMGRAHCKIASIQESYAESFHENFVLNLEAIAGEVKDYHIQRKKLDSRRLTMDAAISKSQKTFKKEKDKKEAEEEAKIAKARYEEMSEDLHARMCAIQENEINQLRDLTQFLNTQMKYAQSYLDILVVLKDEWPQESTIQRVESQRRVRAGTPSRALASRSTTPITLTTKSVPPSSDEEDGGASDQEAHSKSSSRQRKRSNSAGTSGGGESTAAAVGRSLSVAAGWATSAVNSVPGFKKKGETNSFTALDEDHDQDNNGDSASTKSNSKQRSTSRGRSGKLSRKNSQHMVVPPESMNHAMTTNNTAFPTKSPRTRTLSVPASAGTTADSDAKRMKVLYEFTATGSDEMDLVVGDEIVVLSEVSDGWWLGESKTGRKGLFPVTYTEEVAKKPPLPARLVPPMSMPPAPSPPMSDFSESVSPIDMLSTHNQTSLGLQNHHHHQHEDDEPFGDQYSALSPALSIPGIYGNIGRGDDDDDDNDETGLFAHKDGSKNGANGKNSTNGSKGVLSSSPFRRLTATASGKKAPPPPPPSRRTTTQTGTNLSSSSFTSSLTQAIAAHSYPNGHSSSLLTTPSKPRNGRSLSAGSVLLSGFKSTNSQAQKQQTRSPFDED